MRANCPTVCPVDEGQVNFSGRQDLAGKDFSCCQFKTMGPLNFGDANLKGAIFAQMSGGTCAMVQNQGSVLSDGQASALHGANFTGADLTGANLACGLDIGDAIFDYAHLNNVQADWSMFNGASFKNTDLTGANFTDTDMSGLDENHPTLFIGTILNNANFASANFGYNTHFIDCKMIGTNLAAAMGDGASFENVHMYAAIAGSLTINGFRLIDSYAANSSFENFGGTSSDSVGNSTSFENTTLSNSFFDGANVGFVNFSGAFLYNTQFGNAIALPTSSLWTVPSINYADTRNITCPDSSGGCFPFSAPLIAMAPIESGWRTGFGSFGARPLEFGMSHNYRKSYRKKTVSAPHDFDVQSEITSLSNVCAGEPATSYCNQKLKWLREIHKLHQQISTYRINFNQEAPPSVYTALIDKQRRLWSGSEPGSIVEIEKLRPTIKLTKAQRQLLEARQLKNRG